MLSFVVLLMDSTSRSLGSLLVAAFLWSHPTKGYQGVYMCPRNSMNIKDFVENLQILNIVASRGDLDIQRNMWLTFTYQTSNLG